MKIILIIMTKICIDENCKKDHHLIIKIIKMLFTVIIIKRKYD